MMVKAMLALLATGLLLIGAAAFAEEDAKQEVPVVTFEELKFEIKDRAPFERKLLTSRIESLFGKRIQIRGYMMPQNSRTGLTKFVLERDNFQPNSGPPKPLFDYIVVQMAVGKSADFSIRPITVEGIFTFDALLDKDGKHLAIYHLEADSAE